MGACELTDVVFDEVLHPEFIARTAAWTQQEETQQISSADKQQEERQPAVKAKTVIKKNPETKTTASSKTAQSETSSNVSKQHKSDKQTAASTTVSAQKNQKSASAAQADRKKEDSAPARQAIVKEAATSHTPPKKLFFTQTALLSQDQASQATWSYALSKEDLLLLERIVMAEAEGEPYAGKVAVANVVLNRLRSANYPDTIRDVIYQRYQFSPVQNGRFDRVVPSEDSVKAAAEALNGRKEVTDDTYYFVSMELATDMTIPNTRTPVKKIGHHTFFK
ncbi:cell wall hydrolase [Saccharibacillus sp. VR-M41]|uniref:Cell wall hydrolase n=2 Tax=Saccharibacillus alkalitolerans TaxID=2705290 RepID=A0ABX0F2P1_9BACL|nr:cell wall hydrolase [Saccharibacillus alkalitolerans]